MALTCSVLTANTVLMEPDGTVTAPGGWRSELLLDSVTGVPPAPAAAFRVTVQLKVFPPIRLVGLHTSEATPGWAP